MRTRWWEGGLCKACEIEGTKKFVRVREKEKPAQEGKPVQGQDALSLGVC